MTAEEQLRYVADCVEAWPDHPWIPGVVFIHDTKLREIIAANRSNP